MRGRTRRCAVCRAATTAFPSPMCAAAASVAAPGVDRSSWWRGRSSSAIPATNTSARMSMPRGDECLSFHLAPALVEAIGYRPDIWRSVCVPPLPELMVLGELAQAAAEGRSDVGLDELGMLLAARYRRDPLRAAAKTGGSPGMRPAPRGGSGTLDRRELARADRSRERSQGVRAQPVSLSAAFRRVLGVTPHQYLIRSRLRRAARLLACDTRPITEVAFDVGSATCPTSCAHSTGPPRSRREPFAGRLRQTAGSSRIGPPQLRALADPKCADQIALELRQPTKHGQHQGAVRRGGVGPRVAERSETLFSIGDRRKCVQQVARRSRRP